MENIKHIIQRLAKETKAPIKTYILNKVGLRAHEFKAITPSGSTLFVKKKRGPAVGMENTDWWEWSIKPAPIQILNTSDTKPVITSINLFTEFKKKSRLRFEYEINTSIKCWTRDFFSEQPNGKGELPVLSRGKVFTQGFDEEAFVVFEKEFVFPLTEKFRAQKTAYQNYMLALEKTAIESVAVNPLCQDRCRLN